MSPKFDGTTHPEGQFDICRQVKGGIIVVKMRVTGK